MRQEYYSGDYFFGHYAQLNEHLKEFAPIIDSFCSSHGFLYVDRISLGRYPRIRVERNETHKIWLDLWLELDDDGQRFAKFRPDLPYELSAGAAVVIQDGSIECT